MMTWVKIDKEEDLPEKPGKERYEVIACLIMHKDEVKLRMWNCEHRVWDDDEGDDFFCAALEPSHYAVITRP
jgi:hypothetical protein